MKGNSEEEVECPVEGCDATPLKRGLYMHIFQTDDPPGEGHYPRFEEPPYLDMEDLKITGERQVPMDYPDEVDIEEVYYLDTYTGKAFQGKRGLMIHLGQAAGKNNIPPDVTERHDPEDYPMVDIDDDGNITEVHKGVTDPDLPALEPYLPWYSDKRDGFVPRERVTSFVEEVRNTEMQAASADMIEQALLEY